jgi:putative tryptophan/tyrosine transport system substrate-binding protein
MGNPNEQFNWQQIERAARVLGIRPQLLDVRKPEDFERTFNDASEQRIDALVVALDGLLSQNRQIIVDLAAKHRLPAVYGSSEFIIPGGLAAYGPSYSDLYRRAANYVDKILKGVRPADLPVELPTKFQLVINLKTSKSLGLTIPPTILARADEVIE